MNVEFKLDNAIKLEECPPGFFIYKGIIHFKDNVDDVYNNTGKSIDYNINDMVYPIKFEDINVWHKSWSKN